MYLVRSPATLKMEDITRVCLWNFLTFCVLFVDFVSADIDVCFKSGDKIYYCDDGKECCENDTQCCDKPGLSTLAIAGIVIGSIVVLILLIILFVLLCKKGTPVGSEGAVVRTRVHAISLPQEPPPSYMASSVYEEGPPAYQVGYGYYK